MAAQGTALRPGIEGKRGSDGYVGGVLKVFRWRFEGGTVSQGPGYDFIRVLRVHHKQLAAT